MTSTHYTDGELESVSPTRGWLPVRPRERLQNAADTLFPSSIRAVSIDAVSNAARVPKSGFYRHFTSKDDLVEDYLERHESLMRAALQNIDASTSDPVQRLVRLVPLESHNAVMLRAAIEFPEPTSSVRLITSRHRQWVRQWIANQLIELDIRNPREPALEIGALFDALTFECLGSTEHDQTRHILFRRIERLARHTEP